jgi:hypothetical protein
MHDFMPILAALIALPLTGLGCNDDPSLGARDGGADGADAADASPDAADGPAAPIGGLAVVNSNYTRTVVSLIDPIAQKLVHDDCVDSDTVAPGLSLAISGDITLPSQPQLGHDLVLMDGVNSALTWVDPQRCAIRQQLSLGTFNVFPHDVIAISDSKSYVTRYGKNGTPTSDALSIGDDLLIIDPNTVAAIGRIDMAPYAAAVAGTTIQARPDHGLLVDGKVYVTLGNQSADYSAAGEGRIVVIDTATDQVTGTIALTGLKGCSRLDYLAGAHTLFVACGGSFSDADQTAASGIALVRLSDTPPSLQVIPASSIEGAPVNFAWVVAFADDLIFAGTLGSLDLNQVQTAPDLFSSIDPMSGAKMRLLTGGAFDFGRAAGVPASRVIFLPDADMNHPLVHVMDGSSASGAQLADFDPNPKNHFPPREIGWY